MRTNITLHTSRILYDIQNYTYIEWYKVESESDKAGSHQLMADICQSGNIDRVARVLDVAYATVVEMLRPLSRRTRPRQRIGNHVRIPDAYRIELDVPNGIDGVTIDLLARLVHEYLVGKAVVDWLDISMPTASAGWRVKVAETAAMIRDNVNVPLCRMTTRPLSPW